jgi:hypothetical protein
MRSGWAVAILCLLVCLVVGIGALVTSSIQVERRYAERYRRRSLGSLICPQCDGTGHDTREYRANPMLPASKRRAARITAMRSGPCPQCQGTGFLEPGQAGGPDLPARPVNGLAVVSFVLTVAGLVTVVTGIAGAICGFYARKQCWDRGHRGAGLAEASVVGGWVAAVLGLLVVIPQLWIEFG